MFKIKVFTHHQTAGHGWLEATEVDISNVGLSPEAFVSAWYLNTSGYTYVDRDREGGATYFLEDEEDMFLFIQAYRISNGQRPAIKTLYHSGECFIYQLEKNKG